ncbi:MAG TPA: fatty acyl-AMP ligase [Gemmatimonadales bacterium]|jgi:acyl-CoA synthetase (AMP-forming)/AMP-acid ligase II|nr:fatty acyl-AMP ligase [Gemmatimonadales bacterium]
MGVSGLAPIRPVVPEFATLVDTLRFRAERQPDRVGYRFLLDGETREASLTYGELCCRAEAIAALLATLQRTGDRALLVYPPGLDFICAWFGCLAAGSVAVVVQPPHQARLPQFLSRVASVCRDAAPTVALTTSAIRELLAEAADLAPEPSAMRWRTTEAELAAPPPGWNLPRPTVADLAFLQYTSGSTTEPRGVMVSHDNLIQNLRLIRESFAQSTETPSVSWLPPYHDMGLIGGILAPLYVGFPVTLMPPAGFLQRPYRWLRAISRVRATVSGGPNFAYDLCLQRITLEQRAGLDLSSWRVAFNGAEPLNPRTMQEFSEYFEPCGFSPNAFKPCYGLAESTLLVAAAANYTPPVVRSFRESGLTEGRVIPCPEHDPAARALVASGRTVATTLIVDPDAMAECPPGRIGEIWVQGPSVANGYLNRPSETSFTFGARLATGAGPFLRTGDLGFLLEGELFVTGRLKDLIIIGGHNHYPQDIERSVGEAHPALGGGGCAAFSIEVEGREELIVVAEATGRSGPPPAELRRAIRTAVSVHHGLGVRDILLIRRGGIPRTTSGKIRRGACRAAYLARTLDAWGQP